MAIVKEFPANHLRSVSSQENKTVVESLAQQWAKKYIGNLKVDTDRTEKCRKTENLGGVMVLAISINLP